MEGTDEGTNAATLEASEEQKPEILTTYDASDRVLQQIDRVFTYHPPKDDQAARYVALRDQAHELALTIVSLTPESREQSIALTKLEEAIFSANAAIARNE